MKKYWLVLLFMAASSCDTILDVDVPFDHASLVINAIFTADNTWNALISTNGSIYLKHNTQPVKNASVFVYENNMPIDTLNHIGEGFYGSSNGKPLDGHEYEFRASADGFETAIGHSNTPVPAVVTDMTWKAGTEDGQPITIFTIKFKDDPNVENFYEIVMGYAQDYIDETGNVIQLEAPMLIKSGDQVAIQRDDWEYNIALKDVSFNGKKTEVILKAIGDLRYYNIITARLKTVSKDYFKYMSESELQSSVEDNPFAQPVNVYCNIEHGFGIVAGFSQSTFTSPRRYPAPIITSVTPMTGKPGDHIIISGENLSIDGTYAGILFSTLQYITSAQLVRISEREIEAIIPSDAVSGHIYVRTIAGTVAYTENFEVIE